MHLSMTRYEMSMAGHPDHARHEESTVVTGLPARARGKLWRGGGAAERAGFENRLTARLREFESPPLRYMRNVAGFTNRSRAPEGRGCRLLGKTTMFLNDFQGFSKFHAKRSVLDFQVRAVVFQKLRFDCEIF